MRTNWVQHQTGVKAASLVKVYSKTKQNKKKNLKKVTKCAPCEFSATPLEKCWSQRAFLGIVQSLYTLFFRADNGNEGLDAQFSLFFFFFSKISNKYQEFLKTSAVALHTWLFFTRPWFLSIASFTNERRALGGGLQPDLAQLSSVSFGISVHKELQDPRAESVTLHIEHRAGTITEGRQNRWHAILMSGYLQPAVCPTLLWI